MNLRKNQIKIFSIEPGRWPLLSRKTFPLKIEPKQNQKDQWIFEDYGCNHALPYMLLLVLSIGTVFLVDLLPDSNWGDPDFPIEAKYTLVACSILLGLYSFFATLISTDLKLSTKPPLIKLRHLLFGLIPVAQREYECQSISIQINPVCIAFTRVGLGQSNCFGVFIFSDTNTPMKLIACFKSEDNARCYANEIGHSIGIDVIQSSESLSGRLSR